jgi:hypothetical protein
MRRGQRERERSSVRERERERERERRRDTDGVVAGGDDFGSERVVEEEGNAF